jgi:hypothetical protein
LPLKTALASRKVSLEYLTIENIGKTIALIVSVIAAYKAFAELVSKKKEKLRADYEFAEKFIADDKWKKIHDYLLERGYWGLSGRQLEASLIRYYLEEKDPLGKLTDYTQGVRFLSVVRNEKQEVTGVSFSNNLDTVGKRNWKKIRLSIGYFSFAFLSLGPVIFIGDFLTIGLAGVAGLLAWVLSFGLLAYMNIDEVWSFHSAERIVKFEANKPIKQD